MHPRRAELFPADPGLTARMVLAAFMALATVVAALAAIVLLAPLKIIIGVAIAATVGVVALAKERRAEVAAREVDPAEAPALHASVERLCLIADLPKPRIVVEPERQPNSWVAGVGADRTRLHLTRGLLDCLEPAELEGVIAHELAHVANRDATVMTVVGGPGTALLSGGRRLAGKGGFWIVQIGGLVAILVGWLATLSTRVLSRTRELAADAAAARMTGNPAALAAALTKVSDGLAATPRMDLRSAAARDAFHLLPVSARSGGPSLPMPGTHPPLSVRIARLEALERGLQAARPQLHE